MRAEIFKLKCPVHGFTFAATDFLRQEGWVAKCPLKECKEGIREGWTSGEARKLMETQVEPKFVHSHNCPCAKCGKIREEKLHEHKLSDWEGEGGSVAPEE